MLPIQKSSCISKSSPTHHHASRSNRHLEVQCILHLLQHHDLPSELNLFIFVSSLKIMCFQLSMVQLSYFWANLRHARTCLQIIICFLCYICAFNPSSFKARLIVMLDKLFISFRPNMFCCCRCNSKLTFSNRIDTMPLLSVYKKFKTPFYLSFNLVLYILRCTTKDWLMPTKTTTLQVETLLLSCDKAWCFCFWDNGGIRLQTILQLAPHIVWNQGYTMHKKSHDVLNHTMHIEMLMLEEWRRQKWVM